MHSFLRDTAEKILQQNQELQRLVIVLPNRRAGLFFAQHLGTLIQQPSWMPVVCTIEDIFYQYAGQRPADDLILIFELYRVYTDLHPEPETFDRFYHWGELILKDFNDVDQFLVDARKLYHQLSEIKEFESDLSYLTESQIKLINEFWKSFERQDRRHQEKFLKFWKLLSPLYQAFQASLEVSGLAYSGQLYRKVAEGLDTLAKPEKRHVFIGFNAFTGTEEKLFKHFITEFEAEVYWDIDSYYLDDLSQEAGMFFRAYQKDRVLGPTFPDTIPERIASHQAKVKVYSTPLKVNQANLVGSILSSLAPNEALEETVVILPDEQMLFPVLHSLPESIGQVNVTMGYPVKNVPIYAFLESVLELQRFVKVEEGKILFYHKAVKNILSSTYFRQVNSEFIRTILNDIQEHNQIYISQETLLNGGTFFELVFQKPTSEGLFAYLSELIVSLAERLEAEPLQRSYLYQCYKQLNRLKAIFSKQEETSVDLNFFIRLFRQVFRQVKLPFEGEPLQGLQIMGVLESRNLDFKRVIICNMNEGSFPPSSPLNSMVPYSLRKAFGLPVQEQNEAVYAYTFYRLFHSAEEVHLIYSTASDQGKAGEKSRYIQQIDVEMGEGIDEDVIYVPVDLKYPSPVSIEKTPEVMALLDKYLVGLNGMSITSFSPSALSVYLDCRFRFYLQYLANIKERDEVKEEVDAAVFGNIAHYSLEFLYQGFRERKERDLLEKDDFADLKKHWVFPAIEKAVRKFYHLEEAADTKLSGQMAIVRDVMQKYLIRLLEIDEQDAPFRLVSMEKSHQAYLQIQTSSGLRSVGLRGYIDRVDEHNKTIRLIDYKSGADKKEFTDISSLFDRDDNNRNKAAMQTLFYGFLYQFLHPENSRPLKPALFNFKEIFKDDFNPYLQQKNSRSNKTEVQDYADYQTSYESGLKNLLEEVYNPEVPFTQTEELKKCTYCAYTEICGRKG